MPYRVPLRPGRLGVPQNVEQALMMMRKMTSVRWLWAAGRAFDHAQRGGDAAALFEMLHKPLGAAGKPSPGARMRSFRSRAPSGGQVDGVEHVAHLR